MKRLFPCLILCLICVALLLNFSACFGEENSQETKKTVFDVTFSLNSEKSIENKVCINTNLPCGTFLDVNIWSEDGSDYYSTETVTVQEGKEKNFFITAKQGDINGNEIADGNYVISVNMLEEGSQPSGVLEIIGQNGEYMNGEYVFNTDLGRIAKFSKPIIKTGDKFTMPE